MTSVDYQ